MPSFSAAWMTVVPSATITSRPSMVSLGMLRDLPGWGFAAGADVGFELVAEFCDIGLDRPRCGIREDANGLPFHVAGDGEQVVQVLKGSVAFGNAIHNAMHPAGPLTARSAL